MTFEEILRKHGFEPHVSFTEEWVKGEHPLLGEGVAVVIDEVYRGDDESPSVPVTYIFDACFNERDDESILEWAESQNMVPEGYDKTATDGAYGAVWDIYGTTPEQLDKVLDRVQLDDRK